VLALFNFGLFFPLLVVAVYRLPGGVAAAVGGLQPLLVAGFSWALAGRRPRAVEIGVGVVAAVGVALVVLEPGAGFDAVGLLAAAGANVSFAVGVVLTKRFPAPPPERKLAATGAQLLIGGALLLPLTLVVEGPPPAFDGRNLLGAAYLTLGATGLAFVLWFNGIRRLPAAAPPLLGLAAPVTGVTLGWILLGQSLDLLQLLGFAVTLSAIAYGTTLGRRAAAAPVVEGRGPAGEQALEPELVAHGGLGGLDRSAVGPEQRHELEVVEQGDGPVVGRLSQIGGGRRQLGEPVACDR
jgi:probable blue pigment (indigoidine) exporter